MSPDAIVIDSALKKAPVTPERNANGRKTISVAALDPVNGRVVGIFHPRRDEWDQHFRWRDTHIIGLTPIGRATVHVLALNDARRLALRGVGLSPQRRL